MPQDPNALVWIDLEMTGLNTDTDRIIEIATHPHEIVLDCFLGSGTTASVAHKLGRR